MPSAALGIWGISVGYVGGLGFAVALLAASIVFPAPPGVYGCGGHDFRADMTSEMIRNGGFEQDLSYWPTTPGIGGANSPAIVTSPVHAGLKAAEIDAVESPATHANQSLPSLPPAYLFTHWFYVQEWGTGGLFATFLMKDWTPDTGVAAVTTSVAITSSGLQWVVWKPRAGGGVTTTVPMALALDAWHFFAIVVDSAHGVQCLFVDGTLAATLSVDPSLAFSPALVLFGDVSYSGDAGVAVYDDFSTLRLDEVAPPAAACPLSQGFWKTHPAAWPVDSLTLGASAYAKAGLLTLLRTPPRGDASLILAHQLVAAKLNLANGSDPTPVVSDVAAADHLLAQYPGTLPFNVKASTDAGQQMTAVAAKLDAFNNGLLTPGCAPSPLTTERPTMLPTPWVRPRERGIG